MNNVKMFLDVENLIGTVGAAVARSKRAKRRAGLACVAVIFGLAWAYHKFNDMAVKISVLQREIDNLREED